MIVTQIGVSQWIWLLPSLAKAHRLWTDLTAQCVGAALGMPWHELVFTCLSNGLMAKWPLSYSLEVKLCECLLSSSVTKQRKKKPWQSKPLLCLYVKAASQIAFKRQLRASEQEADCGENAYRNDHKWRPTDLGWRWDPLPWTLTYLPLQSPEADDDLLNGALSHLCLPQVLEGYCKGQHNLREKE